MVKHPVPYWKHQYIYNFSQINTASPEQVAFYHFFKTSFLKGKYIKLKGNKNYAFLLLFDLLRNDYSKHRNLQLLKKQFEQLGYYYPRTRSCTISFLIEQMKLAGDQSGIARLKTGRKHCHRSRRKSARVFNKIIVGEPVEDRNLEMLLQNVFRAYKTQRKKIQLDIKSIERVKQQHADTVELLNEYLKDEDEINQCSVNTVNTGGQIVIDEKADILQDLVCDNAIPLTLIQQETLDFFSKNNFSVPVPGLETFARSKGVFKNQLVESINDSCFECLDDLLIEEEDDFFTINPDYYQRLLAQ